MAALDDLFRLMVKEGASDLHLSPGYSPFFRIHGHMIKLNSPPLPPAKTEKYIIETMSEEQHRKFKRRWEYDWSYQLGDGSSDGSARFRCNAFMQNDGIGAVYRLIPQNIKTIDELKLPEQVRALADYTRGLVLVTGPTGSGKTTTLAALIQHVNLTRKEHIITIEDPIEYTHKGKNCLINQREVGRHTKSFANALRSALREDPDVILIGEMRDPETMALALTAAETGHLVFATLHTNSAAKSIDRVIDSFPADQQAQIRVMLSESLLGILAQTLLPRSDQPGMVPAIELMLNTSSIRNLIRENKVFQIPSVLQTSGRKGMIPLQQSLQGLLDQKFISPATMTSALAAANA